MKRLLFISVLAAAVTACVEGNNPVQLIDAIPLSPSECGQRNEGVAAQYSGSLDYAGSMHYYMTFGIFSPLTAETDESSPAGFIGEEIVYSYESLGVKTTFKEESLPVYLVVSPGAQPDESYIVVDLIGAEARKKLDQVVPARPDTMTLLSTIKLKGKLGSGRTVETNEVTYPIEITRSDPCPENTKPVPANPAFACGNPGQDGISFICQ